MRTLYRVLAYAIAGLVAVQAGAMAFGVAGLSHAVDTGGVVDRFAFDDPDSFPGGTGLALHEINGGIVIPALALLLLVVAAFAKVPRGSWWAAAVLALVVVQTMLGYSAADLPALGALHGVNALLVFTTALFAGRRARVPDRGAVEAETTPSATAEV